MQMGNTAEKLTVTAETPLLEAAEGSVGNIADDRRTTQLPVAHGQRYKMMTLGPGVVWTANPINRPYETNTIAQYAMDGVPGGHSEITLDGSSNMTLMNLWAVGNIAAAYTPPPDIVQEVKVETAAYDASIGHTQGGITSITLKSGGNRPHGTAYWFARNPGLDANLFFSNATNLPRPDSSSDRWGVASPGPASFVTLAVGRSGGGAREGPDHCKRGLERAEGEGVLRRLRTLTGGAAHRIIGGGQ